MKDIIIFGTGNYFRNYMIVHGLMQKPLFAVDNDKSKTGRKILGLEIREPSVLKDLKKDSFYVIICSAQRESIGKQLEEMGIIDYQYYSPVDYGSLPEVTDSMKPKYHIGYVPGVYDLFHIGHLNLLRNSKSRCEYLIVGVLTDELVEHFKGKRPYIPYEQRAAVIESVRYADRVVPVDFDNTRKIDAWNKYHFDCHFSGNDHGADWEEDIRQLRAVGSNMEFFTYTQATSSTEIKKQIK